MTRGVELPSLRVIWQKISNADHKERCDLREKHEVFKPSRGCNSQKCFANRGVVKIVEILVCTIGPTEAFTTLYVAGLNSPALAWVAVCPQIIATSSLARCTSFHVPSASFTYSRLMNQKQPLKSCRMTLRQCINTLCLLLHKPAQDYILQLHIAIPVQLSLAFSCPCFAVPIVVSVNK